MKKFFIAAILLFMIPILIFGCNGVSLDAAGVSTVTVLTEITARNIGCEVSKAGDKDLDRTLRNVYMSVKAGNLTNDAIKQLGELTASRPTLAADVASLVKLFGVKNLVDDIVIEPIPPEIFAGIEAGYQQGYDLCLD